MGSRQEVAMALEPDPREVLKDYIVKNGLKTSRQRELIAETFFAAGGHLSVDELLERVRGEDPKVGQATVYRTMKLLTKCGLAEPRQFGDGHTRYEPSLEDEEHHDHIICTACGKITEFVNPQIEALQHRMAEKHGFRLTHHKMELYGLCDPPCAEAAQADRQGRS
jgi:Fur family transcriptional regulator, ferric uptake regulator